jgi:hypothetical protein
MMYMVDRDSITMIRVKVKTADKLKQLGIKGEKYQDIVDKLASAALKSRSGRQRDCNDDLC